MGEMVNLLDRDVYTMSQADRLLAVTPGTSRRWIDGYERQGQRYEPLVRSEPTGSGMVTWGEFVEARLISEYRRYGVTVFKMRSAIMALREEFDTQYPLAHARPFTDSDGRDLVMRVQEDNNLDIPLYFVIRTGQMIMPSMEIRRFQQVADYGVVDHGDGRSVCRRLNIAEHVTIDPRYASGEPTIKGRRVRVDILTEAINAGEQTEDIAHAWGIPPQAVEDAVRCSNVA